MFRHLIVGLILIIIAATAANANTDKYTETDGNDDPVVYYDTRDYSEVESIVEPYLNKTYGLDGEITNTSFQQYSEGFTGGLFMYIFRYRCKDGSEIIFSYSEYVDVCDETLERIEVVK